MSLCQKFDITPTFIPSLLIPNLDHLISKQKYLGKQGNSGIFMTTGNIEDDKSLWMAGEW